MLSPEERQEIEAELHHYPTKKAVSIDAMRIVQNHRGWVSDEAITDIAEFLDMSAAELDGVSTWYNLIYRRPVGRHVILLCDSVSCFVMGYEGIREYLVKKLGIGYGETTPDGRYTLLPIACLGDCDHAPTLMIDTDAHRDLTPDKLDEILERYE